VRLDPLGLFGGRAVAVAGNFAGPALAGADWAVYGRTRWLGKLALELVGGEWIDLSKQGFTVKPLEQDGERVGFELAGGRLQRPLFVARLADVVIVATRGEFLAQARALESTRGQDSLDRSAKYQDNVVRTGRPNDELELYVDQRALAENVRVAGTWPDPTSTDLATALASRLFQLGAVREVIGTVDFAPTVSVDLVGELSSNVLTPFQQRLYDTRGFDKDRIRDAARLVHADAGLFVYLHADVGDLLRELRAVVAGVDPAAITNLEDFVRSAWSYPDLEPLIDDLDAALRDRIGFFVREYDYPAETGEKAPPSDGTPVFAWALALWPEDVAKVEAIRNVIGRDDVLAMLKIGRDGLWDNTLQGGAKVKEYWNALVPGTGHIATLDMKSPEGILVVSNENRLLGQVFKIYTTGRTEEGYTPLSEQSTFQTWVTSGLGSANALAWFAPRALGKTARRVAAHRLAQSAADYIDWGVERPRIEREVLARDFPAGLTPENSATYEARVQEEVDRFQASYVSEHLPELQARAENVQRAWEGLSAAFVELQTDRKRLRLHGRIGLGLEAAGPAAAP
jgi:hypothetical protein